MKVKTLIQMLQKLDPDLTVVVQEENGCDDACRPVVTVKSVPTNQLPWPARKNPPRGHQVVFLSAVRT